MDKPIRSADKTNLSPCMTLFSKKGEMALGEEAISLRTGCDSLL